MKEYLIEFLGQGESVEFSIFTPAHFIPVLMMLAVILLIRRYSDRLGAFRHEASLRYVLAFALILSEMSFYWRLVAVPSLGPNPAEHLPITICGWAAIFASYMVIGKSQTLFDICYFWLLAGSVFALLTPTVLTYTGPQHFRYYQFWIEHTLGYVAVFYMIFVHKMRPTIRSMIKAYVAMVALAVVAFVSNRMVGQGANYLFLARPEDAPSVLDILPPNFLIRTSVMAVVISLLYVLVYLPWYLRDRKAKKVEIDEGVSV